VDFIKGKYWDFLKPCNEKAKQKELEKEKEVGENLEQVFPLEERKKNRGLFSFARKEGTTILQCDIRIVFLGLVVFHTEPGTAQKKHREQISYSERGPRYIPCNEGRT